MDESRTKAIAKRAQESAEPGEGDEFESWFDKRISRIEGVKRDDEKALLMEQSLGKKPKMQYKS